MDHQEVVKFVRGTEASILSSTPIKGYIFFALDTQKIYYGSGTQFILMGSNSESSGENIHSEVLQFIQNRIISLENELNNNEPGISLGVNQHALVISGKGANVINNTLYLNSLFLETEEYTA